MDQQANNPNSAQTPFCLLMRVLLSSVAAQSGVLLLGI
jgi:hypothetical protein